MTKMNRTQARTATAAALAALLLAACGGNSPDTAKTADEAVVEDAAAELAAKEEELAKREAELALKQRETELAQREADLASKELAAAKRTAAPRPAATTAAAPAAAAAPVVKPVPVPPKPLVVPAGTKLSAELVTPLSSKTNRRGDRIEARILADIMVDGERAIPAGSILSGTVSERVSGSKEIGSTPVIGVAFDTLSPDADRSVAVSSAFVQSGKSEGGRDAAKIAGGAVAGAVIGHQVDSDKGKVIGGILGAVAGSAAAKNTGTEIELPAGTVISVTLDNAVEMKR